MFFNQRSPISSLKKKKKFPERKRKSASTVGNSGSLKASLTQPSLSSNSRRRISAAPSLLNMHLPFNTSTIEFTIWSVFLKAFNPSSNLARSPRIAREVPARSSLLLLCATWIRTGTAPERTAKTLRSPVTEWCLLPQTWPCSCLALPSCRSKRKLVCWILGSLRRELWS
ncbi:unnamed protein product, partial [Vitis vinifera]